MTSDASEALDRPKRPAVGLALVYGIGAVSAVLAVAGASVAAVAPRFGLKPTRTWIVTVAIVLAIALADDWLLAARGF